MDENVIKFYLKHSMKVNRIKAVRDAFVNYVISEIEKTRISLEEFEPYNNRNEEFRYYLCPHEGNLMITVYFKGLIEGTGKVLVIVELQNDLLMQKEKLCEIHFDEAIERPLLCERFYDTSKENYAHFALQSFELSENELLDLSNSLAQIINDSPILNIYRKVKMALVEKP